MNSYVNISIVGKNPKLFIKRYVLNQISFEDFKEVIDFNEVKTYIQNKLNKI